MRFLKNSVIGLFLIGCAVALMLYAFQLVYSAVQEHLNSEQHQRPLRERVFAVNVVTAEVGAHIPVLEAFGRVESRRTLELRTALAGRIVWVSDSFQEGGKVTAGDVLVEVDKSDATSALKRAEADQMEAAAQLRDAERALILARDELATTVAQAALRDRAFERQTDLRDRGVGTEALVETAELAAVQAQQSVITQRQSVSQAEASVDQAKSQLARAEITVEEAERDLADATITAPFTGTLQSVSLVEGRLVSANEILAELVDPTRLEAAFRISTVQYARLLGATGDLLNSDVAITLDATGAALSVPGRVSRASGAVGTGQSGRLLYAQMDTAAGFKPGDFVTVSVNEPEVANAARLPSSALDAKNSILVLGADNRLLSLPVELVRRQGDDVLVRGDGLAGQQVVVGRTPLLGEGIRVRPLLSGDAADAQQVTDPQNDELVELSDERRAHLVQLVQDNTRMPEEARARVLGELEQSKVPAALVDRIESRMGG